MIPDHEIKDAFENLARLKGSKTKKVDSIMMHAAMVLHMCAGLKKKEISEVKIQDIKYQSGRISGIDPNSQGGNDNYVSLTGFPAQVLHEYLYYLRSSGKHNLSPNLPLFPDYEGDSGQKKLYRHLAQIPPFRMGSFLHGWNLNELLIFGMTDYYQNEIKSGKTDDEAIQSTARQYRVNERTVTDNLNQNKKMTPNSFEKLLKHWDELIIRKFSSQKEVDAFREEGIKLINRMRITDKHKITEMFNNSITDRIAYLNQSQPPIAIKHKSPCDLQKALQILVKAVNNSREESDARKRIIRATKKMEKYYFGEESK